MDWMLRHRRLPFNNPPDFANSSLVLFGGEKYFKNKISSPILTSFGLNSDLAADQCVFRKAFDFLTLLEKAMGLSSTLFLSYIPTCRVEASGQSRILVH